MPSDPTTPDLADVIMGAIEARLLDVHTALPGIVQAYDAATQTASVQIGIKRAYHDEADVRQLETLPVVNDCPVAFQRSGPYAITFPLAVGTTGIILFASASIDQWAAIGGVVDPKDDRRFNLSDAFFIPSVSARRNALDDVPDDAMVLYSPGEIRLGSADADDPVIRASDLAAFRSTFNSHVHTGVSTGGGLSGTPSVPQGAIAGSSKVMAD